MHGQRVCVGTVNGVFHLVTRMMGAISLIPSGSRQLKIFFSARRSLARAAMFACAPSQLPTRATTSEKCWGAFDMDRVASTARVRAEDARRVLARRGSRLPSSNRPRNSHDSTESIRNVVRSEERFGGQEQYKCAPGPHQAVFDDRRASAWKIAFRCLRGLPFEWEHNVRLAAAFGMG